MMVAIGQVERIIWWNGTDTIFLRTRSAKPLQNSRQGDTDNETLLMAMLSVNNSENATRMRFSRVPSRESFSRPVAIMTEQPMEVAVAWSVVSSHGYEACVGSQQ